MILANWIGGNPIPFFLQHKEYTDKNPKNKTSNNKRAIFGLNVIMQV